LGLVPGQRRGRRQVGWAFASPRCAAIVDAQNHLAQAGALAGAHRRELSTINDRHEQLLVVIGTLWC
jgi:hypothetical protein